MASADRGRRTRNPTRGTLLYLPGEHVGIVRVREGLLELHQLGIGEGRPVAALLPPRVVVHARDGRRAAVVLGEVAAVAGAALMVVAVVAVHVIHGRRDDHLARVMAVEVVVAWGTARDGGYAHRVGH